MFAWAIRRLFITLATLFVGVTAIFAIIHLIPGDPVALLLDEHFSQESYESLERRLGLHQPLWKQYLDYLYSVVIGDWGTSFRTQQAVLPAILDQFPFTVQLALGGMLVSAGIGIPAGIISAVYQHRMIDQVAMILALLGICVPSFWLAILLLLLFTFYLGWLPSVGVGGEDWFGSLKYVILPAIALGTRSAAVLARISRSAMLDVLGQDYVRTARAKGLREFPVLSRHAFRNAMIPVLTVLGLDLGAMLAGTTITEIVFSRPGVGAMLIDAVRARDFPVIQGTLMFYIVVIVLANTLVDILYTVVDPRIQLN